MHIRTKMLLNLRTTKIKSFSLKKRFKSYENQRNSGETVKKIKAKGSLYENDKKEEAKNKLVDIVINKSINLRI